MGICCNAGSPDWNSKANKAERSLCGSAASSNLRNAISKERWLGLSQSYASELIPSCELVICYPYTVLCYLTAIVIIVLYCYGTIH